MVIEFVTNGVKLRFGNIEHYNYDAKNRILEFDDGITKTTVENVTEFSIVK